VAVNVHRQGRI